MERDNLTTINLNPPLVVSPNAEPNNYTTLSAQEAAKIIRQGDRLVGIEVADLRELLECFNELPSNREIICHDCRILTCNGSGLTLSRSVRFTSTVFASTVDFSEANLERSIQFLEGTFQGALNFRCAQFQADVQFSRCQFASEVDFSESRFHSLVQFTDNTFHTLTAFEDIFFNRAAFFTNNHFKENVIFDRSSFGQQAHFTETYFHHNVYAHDVRFQERTHYDACSFQGDLSFTDATFSNLVSFDGTVFHGQVSFHRATLKSQLLLQKARFRPDARLNLLGINLTDTASVFLTLNQLGRFQCPTWVHCLLPLRLRTTLSVTLMEGEDARYEEGLKNAAEQYNFLRDHFRSLPGVDDEEDRCHYKYKDLTRRSKGPPKVRQLHNLFGWTRHWTMRFFDWFLLKWGLGYCIYTKRIFVTALVVIALFGSLYQYYAGPETVKGYDGNFNAFYFSAITFTTIGYGDYAPQQFLRFFASLEGLIGLVFMAILTVSFGRKLIR